MAAGLGFKTFTTGEVLTASDTNGYLMQGVNVFASAAARDAAITSPQEGQFAYLKDTNVTTYYTGSAWANLDTTGMTNPMTTTGDVIYSSPGSTPVRLGIGSTGQVLTVSGGLPSWATAASAFDPLFNLKPTGYYVRNGASVAVGNTTFTNNVAYYMPVYLSASSYDRISIQTNASFSGTATIRLGLYNADAATGKPTTVAFDAGTVSCTAASTNYEITISQTVTAGWYFIAFNTQSNATTNNFTSVGSSNATVSGILPTYSSVAGNTPSSYYTQTGVTGAFATAGTLVAPGSTAPLVSLRLA